MTSPSLPLPPNSEGHTWTREFLGIYGSYSWLNSVPLLYFSTTMTSDDLAQSQRVVALMNEIEGSETWGFASLFQRDIDHNRVAQQLVDGYLRRQDRTKFFPAITVVLLPAENNRIKPRYTTEPSVEVGDNANTPCVSWVLDDGLRIGFPGDSREDEPTVGRWVNVSWDRKRFMAAVVDGQHRVAALRAYAARFDQNAPDQGVPVTVALFGPRIPTGQSLIKLTRELFIDVNQNADRVASTRLVLLDDRDVTRVAARSLVRESWSDEPAGLSQLPSWEPAFDGLDLQILSGIPQEVVDLRADETNADLTRIKDWQFTSGFTLARIVRKFLFRDRWKEFERALGVSHLSRNDGVLGKALSERRDLLEADEDDEDDVFISKEELFTFSHGVTESLVQNYFAIGVGLLPRFVFTGFTPYQQFLRRALIEFGGGDGVRLRQLLLAESEPNLVFGESRFAKGLKKEDPDCYDRLVEAIGRITANPEKEKGLEWYSVLQRALMSDPRRIQSAIGLGLDAEPDVWAQCAAHYVSTLNTLHGRGMFRMNEKIDGWPLWRGLALRLRESISLIPTDSAARNCGALIRLCVAAELAAIRGLDAKQFYAELCDNSRKLQQESEQVAKSYAKQLKERDSQDEEKEAGELAEYLPEARELVAQVLDRFVFVVERD